MNSLASKSRKRGSVGARAGNSFVSARLLMPFLILSLFLATASLASEVIGQNEQHEVTKGVHDDDGHEGEEAEPAYAVLFPWFTQALGVLVFFLLTRYMHAIPYTAVLFTLGILMGVGASLTMNTDQLTLSIDQWISINAEVLFVVFLPGLLFKDALEVNFHLFQASFWQLITMAFPMVLAGTVLTAVAARYIVYDWSWHLALTFGSILAATDPVAVAALLTEVGAPPRLKIHISGESLLNDGSAMVFYTVFSGLYLTDIGVSDVEASFVNGLVVFLRMALGGVALGIAFALGLIAILYKLDRRFEREETVLQVVATVTVAYLSFYTSEVTCHMSGVIAVVTTGIITKAFGGGLISDWQVMDSFWSLLEHLMNTAIFALGGIQFGALVASSNWEAINWGELILLYLLVNLIRFLLVFMFFPINSRIGLGMNWKEATFSSWAGLRGAVGIALALGLDNKVKEESSDPEVSEVTSKVFGLVGGIAFFTLIVNGTLSGPLLTRLGLADATKDRKRIIRCAEEAARRKMLDDFIHLMTDQRFYFVDFALVKHHCPLLKDITTKDLQTAIEQNQEDTHPAIYKAPRLQHVLLYFQDAAPLRRALERAERDTFMSKDAASSITKRPLAMDLTTLAENGGEKEEDSSPPPSLLQDIRVMFVELLRAAYQAQIHDGELDPREYNGYLSYVLLQSLDFAHDAVMSGGPLEDWSYSHIVTSELLDRAGFFVKKFHKMFFRKETVDDHKTFIQRFRDKEPLQYQQLRLDVLRAFSFIDAHREAQDRLRDEFGDTEGEVASAFRLVMDESKAQIRKANDVLSSKNKKQLKHVISHHLCIILQNKAARYVRLLMDSGVLLQREARVYLHESDECVRHIRDCKLDRHPGSLDYHETEEYEERRGRKRVKQKSIL